MESELHTFADVFDSGIKAGDETVHIRKIVIPIIQRDYAQGRRDPATARVRERFLNSLYSAVCVRPIVLDFIYGDITEDGVMTPLDGQQRLTTLFLLHWYAAKKEKIGEKDCAFLKNFSYETRYSAREFCACLADFCPSFKEAISDDITDQAWFPLEWLKDPTISAMLVIIDAIDAKFRNVDKLWDKLIGGAISFYFLPIRDMGLTDELYIKMNSRGKPLTRFEHFKAELEQNVSAVDAALAKRLMSEIDIEWTDMLWPYRGGDNLIDDEFLRYFHFVCDILCYKSGGSPQGKSADEFDLLSEYFSKSCPNAAGNIETMEQYFNCWRGLPEGSPASFLDKFFSYRHTEGKVRLEQRYKIDIFGDCLRSYADMVNSRNRQFPLNRIVMLYAITVYLQNRSAVSESDFRRRLRMVSNLIQNSADEISDSENRTSGNRMPAILKQVDAVILTGAVDETIERSFNQTQIKEETDKLKWCADNPEKAESLFALEDHFLLTGQIGVVGLERPELFPRFASLFKCRWDLVDCALMTISNYAQTEGTGGRHQLGSAEMDSAWRNLFHKSANTGFEQTASALRELLTRAENFTDETLEEIISAYIRDCESAERYEWRYYYVKYDSFRPGRYGKYNWHEEAHYDMTALWAGMYYSSKSRQVFLYEIDPEHIDSNSCGRRLNYDEYYVVCEQSGYAAKRFSDDAEICRIDIRQGADGIDKVDRVLIGREFVAGLKSPKE